MFHLVCHRLLLAVHREWQLLSVSLVEEGEVTMIWYKISIVMWHWMLDLEENSLFPSNDDLEVYMEAVTEGSGLEDCRLDWNGYNRLNYIHPTYTYHLSTSPLTHITSLPTHPPNHTTLATFTPPTYTQTSPPHLPTSSPSTLSFIIYYLF